MNRRLVALVVGLALVGGTSGVAPAGAAVAPVVDRASAQAPAVVGMRAPRASELELKLRANYVNTCKTYSGYNAYRGGFSVRAKIKQLPYGTKKKQKFFAVKEVRWDRKAIGGGWRNMDRKKYNSPTFKLKDVPFITTVGDVTGVPAKFSQGQVSAKVTIWLKKKRTVRSKTIWKESRRYYPRYIGKCGGWSPGSA